MDAECWNYPIIGKKECKLLNKKYCSWYPERDAPKLRKLEPNFDHCKTLYTKCDYEAEACVHEQVIRVEDEFRLHEAILQSEIELECRLVEKLWEISQRYLILTESVVCIKPYPEIVSKPTEEYLIIEFNKIFEKLSASINRLRKSLENIRESINELDRRAGKLDWTIESPYLLGDLNNWYRRPLPNIRKTISDLFQYFYEFLCKQRQWVELITINDSIAIEDYLSLMKSLKKPDDFLMVNLKNCKCLRTNCRKCIDQYKHCD